ncbi:hypothetical protein AB0E99_22750 [Streptomyces sp. NPDC030592]|uniref:hypothetical protein n=1 Tax=Streptomyces sp. NPDC030592 TaxID=3155365 RepID=UPI0033EA03B2
MSSTEEILQQIDTATADRTVSDHAMRCRPMPEPEAAQQLGDLVRAFVRALQPVVQAAAATLRQLDEALRAAGHTPGGKPDRRRDRPAWQSPYGPPPRRKR